MEPEDAAGDEILRIYELFVDSAHRVGEARARANQYMLSTTSLLATIFGSVGALSDPGDNQEWLAIIPIAGSVLCLAWSAMIVHYRRLAGLKFKVIDELEDLLPVQPFRLEWQQAEAARYIPMSKIEAAVPVVFFGVFIAASIAAFVVGF